MRNAEEIAYWNAEAGSKWCALQQRIDRAFAPLNAPLYAAAAIRPGEAVLDIGCGCGATSITLARAVGAQGSVLGVDVSRPMLALAERRSLEIGIGNASFVLADASTYAFEDGAYDLACSRFGVMFFDDPIDAFANLRRSLRPGGRFVFACWRELAANPWFHVPAQAVRPHVPPQPKPHPDAPGPLAFASADRVRTILEGAGFEAACIEPFDATLSLGTRSDAVDLVSQIGPTGRLLTEADEHARATAERALDEALSDHEVDGDVGLTGAVWIVSATNPVP